MKLWVVYYSGYDNCPFNQTDFVNGEPIDILNI